MKMREILFGPFLLGSALLLFLALCWMNQAMYAVGTRNLEIAFVVTSAETGDPIPGATISLFEEKEDGLPQDQHILSILNTDQRGMARFVREDNSCEEINRPFRKKITLIDLTWGSVEVTASGYSSPKRAWLQGAKYQDKGYFSKDGSQHIEIAVPLQRKVGE